MKESEKNTGREHTGNTPAEKNSANMGVTQNPNPRANENIRHEEESTGGISTGEEITDGEDA